MLFKKGLTTLVILLFFGLAVSPSINANVSKQDDLVELNVEFCGLGKKHSVKLTQEEYNEVELLFDDIQDRLEGVESDEEAVTIFNEAIVKLDSYGLLGGLSIKQAKRLITFQYQALKNDITIQESEKNDIFNADNYLCLIAGNVTLTRFFSIPFVILILLENKLPLDFFKFFLSLYYIFPIRILHKILFIADTFHFYLSVILLLLAAINYIKTPLHNIRLYPTITLGECIVDYDNNWQRNKSNGWIWTKGENGIKRWDGLLLGNFTPHLEIHGLGLGKIKEIHYYTGVKGFFGIAITNLDTDSAFLLGYANGVKIKNGL